ncbi:hypothetical protein G6O69_14940 [Pseudenhygromyxa sp. WMMC2535]|uniref:hypothetical protein n=1 Tax=Pseudenhygromyxa sp. WMMC2535 TaxID=2712867 RepID=UPI001595D9B1|nr:hypothetical protein [Pseudenhygromyxa sp. WMMC2535]NVB39138.1 hypothetical protein [Pseudenhygromyxa sp. WMMC2535]
MPSRPNRRPRAPRLAALAGLAALPAVSVAVSVAAGCADESAESTAAIGSDPSAAAEPSSGHLGQVHLVIQPTPDELEPEPQLQVRARFVEYRGVSETFVRARTNLPVAPWRQLVPGQCMASESLLPQPSKSELEQAQDQGRAPRELSLIDAGDLRVQLGSRELVAPLVLVPDILPWLTGVEYVHVDDRLPSLAVDPDGTAPVTISLDGSPDGAIEPFSSGAVIPEQFELVAASVDDGRMNIAWRPPGRGISGPGNIVLQLQAFAPVDDGLIEPRGEEVTCLVADTGRAALALAPLSSAGLGVDAELLRVAASRFDASVVRVGSFGEVEVVVELRVLETLGL